jgi:NADH-quinone oxidoreductase subunit M
MNWQSLPWAELTIGLPLVGAGVAGLARDRDGAWRASVGFALAALAASIVAGVAFATQTGERLDPFSALGRPLFAVDRLSASLLPMSALITFLTVLSAPRSEGTRFTYARLLSGEAVQLAAFATADPWLLVSLLSLRALPTLLALIARRKPIRVYVLHVGLYAGLLLAGWRRWGRGRWRRRRVCC